MNFEWMWIWRTLSGAASRTGRLQNRDQRSNASSTDWSGTTLEHFTYQSGTYSIMFFLFHSLLLLFVLIWLLQQIFCKVHNIKCSKIRNSCIIPNLKSNIESLIKFKENSFPRWQHTGSMTIARLQNLSDQSTTL